MSFFVTSTGGTLHETVSCHRFKKKKNLVFTLADYKHNTISSVSASVLLLAAPHIPVTHVVCT